MPKLNIGEQSAKGLARRRELRDERRMKAKRLFENGMPWRKIRHELHISRGTLRNDRIAILAGEYGEIQMKDEIGGDA